MGFFDKLKNKSQQAKGRSKEEAGYQSGDPDLAAEGRRERLSGGAKQVGEQAKDTAKEAKRTFDR